MQIAVTGGLGRLGRYVVRALGDHGEPVGHIVERCVVVDHEVIALERAIRPGRIAGRRRGGRRRDQRQRCEPDQAGSERRASHRAVTPCPCAAVH